MLFNPHWQKPTLKHFIAWLETKDPNERYPFLDPTNCACGRYAQEALGVERGNGGQDWIQRRWSAWIYPLEEIAEGYPRTYGGCLKRAREALANEKS